MALASLMALRLSPAWTGVLTPFLQTGVVCGAIVSAAASWLRHQKELRHYLQMFLLDDLVSWTMGTRGVASDEALMQLHQPRP